eukprot:TRINITY_DN8481_c0_g2_i1.p1 TRINITY_DN8481_c0_g2~~TRINITY_DN8481_c0_g2_i1.p1  ORF type:complete len:393 (-),score=59.74 TRINITY_DN8481_c0_g2_i1:73-1251(-)
MGAASAGCCQTNVGKQPVEEDFQEYQPAPQQIVGGAPISPLERPPGVAESRFNGEGFFSECSEEEEQAVTRNFDEPASEERMLFENDSHPETLISSHCCGASLDDDMVSEKVSKVQNFDAGGHIFSHVLASTGIALVSVAYIRELREVSELLPRRQDLPKDKYISGNTLDHQMRFGAPRTVFVVSHAWLTEEHPDPTGARLNELANTLELVSASDKDLVFFDYCSLHQRACPLSCSKESRGFQSRSMSEDLSDSRDAEEARLFKAARANMDVIFASARVKVLVFPKIHDVSDAPAIFVRNASAYLSRAWCLFEFSIALYFGRIAGGASPHFGEANDDLRNALLQHVIPNANSFEDMALTSCLHTSVPEDLKVICELYKRFYWGRRFEANGAN